MYRAGSFSLTMGAVVAALLSLSTPAEAQWVPYPTFYGGWGGYPLNQDMMRRNDQYAQNRVMQAQGAGQASAAVQRTNDMLMSQGAARGQAQANQRLAARSWWFQTQQNQMTQRSMASAGAPSAIASLPATLFIPSDLTKKDPPKKERSLLAWPTLLRYDTFDPLRDKVESPFKKVGSGGKYPDAEDYRSIIDAVGKMKSTIESWRSSLNRFEYDAILAYLDTLVKDAQERVFALERVSRKADAAAPSE